MVVHGIDDGLQILGTFDIRLQSQPGQLRPKPQQRRIQLPRRFEPRGRLQVIPSLGMCLQPATITGRVVPHDIRQREQAMVVPHALHQTRDIPLPVREDLRVELQLVVDAVGGIRGPASHQRGEMHHIVAALGDSPQMAGPCVRIPADKLGQHGEDGQCVNGEGVIVDGQSGCHVDVVCGCPGFFRGACFWISLGLCLC